MFAKNLSTYSHKLHFYFLIYLQEKTPPIIPGTKLTQWAGQLHGDIWNKCEVHSRNPTVVPACEFPHHSSHLLVIFSCLGNGKWDLRSGYWITNILCMACYLHSLLYRNITKTPTDTQFFMCKSNSKIALGTDLLRIAIWMKQKITFKATTVYDLALVFSFVWTIVTEPNKHLFQ